MEQIGSQLSLWCRYEKMSNIQKLKTDYAKRSKKVIRHFCTYKSRLSVFFQCQIRHISTYAALEKNGNTAENRTRELWRERQEVIPLDPVSVRLLNNDRSPVRLG